MLRGMSSRQFEEWMAYFGIEPFGDEWLRTGTLASMIANANRNIEEKPEPFTPKDFMPIETEASEEDEPIEEDPDAGWKRNKELLTMIMLSKQQ